MAITSDLRLRLRWLNIGTQASGSTVKIIVLYNVDYNVEIVPKGKMNYKKYLKSIKDIFNKNNFNFNRHDVDLYNVHPQIMLVLAVQGILSKRRESLARFILPGLSIALTFVAVGMEIMFVIHGVMVEDFSFAIECFCYLVLLSSIPMVYLGVLGNKEKIQNMLDDMNEDFHHICNLGLRYRKPFLEGQLLIWKLFLGWLILTGCTCSSFIMFPLLKLSYQSLFATQDEHTLRPLAFPMWLPYDDPHRTPNYEIFLLLELNYCAIILHAFCGYVYLLFHFLIHYNTMMDMIILDFEVIFDGLDETVVSLPKQHPARVEVQEILRKRIARIVTWHLSVLKAVSTVSSAFGPPLVYQVSCSSIIICLLSFQVAKRLDEGVVDILFIMLEISACVQLWIPCYLGTLLRNKGFAIGDSCFYSGWNETPLGQLIRADLLIIIYRSQIPIYIKFTGLPNIQLETFSSVMSTSYSYFNMLRQYSS